MGLFGTSPDRLISALLAENSDLRLQLRLERTHWTDERQKLLDRIFALTAPGPLRELRRETATAPQSSPLAPPDRSHVHFPGSRPDTRPPSPLSPPGPPDSAQLSDSERAAVLTSLGLPKNG